jgi:hypothetical protein
MNQNIFTMNWTKLIIGTVIAGIIYFFLGWLVYGILLADAMPLAEGMKELIERKPEEMDMGMMILSCLAWGLLLTYCLMKMGISNWQGGGMQSAILAAIISLSVGAGMVAMYTYTNMQNTLIDVVANAVCSGISGAAAAWYLGRGKTA